MATLATFIKKPLEVQDYDISFVNWLTALGDTGSSIVVEATSGITLVSSNLTSGVVKVWLSGGSANQVYTVTVKLTTTGGRVKIVDIQISVKG